MHSNILSLMWLSDVKPRLVVWYINARTFVNTQSLICAAVAPRPDPSVLSTIRSVTQKRMSGSVRLIQSPSRIELEREISTQPVTSNQSTSFLKKPERYHVASISSDRSVSGGLNAWGTFSVRGTPHSRLTYQAVVEQHRMGLPDDILTDAPRTRVWWIWQCWWRTGRLGEPCRKNYS